MEPFSEVEFPPCPIEIQRLIGFIQMQRVSRDIPSHDSYYMYGIVILPPPSFECRIKICKGGLCNDAAPLDGLLLKSYRVAALQREVVHHAELGQRHLVKEAIIEKAIISENSTPLSNTFSYHR